ncbi:glycine zipper 2TM domain-containing protein [Microbulbifer hydrolyticus]|uniref:Glycine zipper 2TM domain-containing protein n=1 Tax=Microbulbifer hydrolyticus TaxID=48074 RepID=A0A6P1T8E6_9GAMM|nr:glycine zipper 2TM domain-containing protein [Microbulbifer hydrolyticus]MBB5211198.1 surface antigen [Microbulbifer hydrolyticus]QHQ38031.1 glycine zipper 2TM domain-containing protein [Microbulbifer hydrolyticus]
MKYLTTAIAALLCGTLSAGLYAEPPEGRGWKKHKKHHKHEYKEEYWDGNCKVERKWKRNGDYEEERKCKARRDYGHHHHDRGTRVVVLPPWFDQRAPEPEYRPEWRPAPAPQTTATRCNSSQVGSVLGGLIGGVIGHQIGDGRGNTAATIGGAIAGVLVGGKIGRQMDQRNQACVAQALEFAPEGERITWQNENNGYNYAVTPGAFEQRGDQYCRSFVTEIVGQDGQRTQDVACRRQDGTWAPAY